MKTFRILALPSYLPSMSKLNNGKEIIYINPNCDFFAHKEWCNISYLNSHFSPDSYDLVHIFFEYYLISLSRFKKILLYFKKNNKKIIWSWNDRKSLLNNKIGYSYEKLLFRYADKIITPSDGMRKWILHTFDKHKNQIDVIPLGYFSHPDEVKQISRKSMKNRHLFTFLIGDFRDSKEYIQSILNFLHCTDLQQTKLQLIFRPIYLYKEAYENIKEELIYFHRIIQNPRISVFCNPEITDYEMAQLFYTSHAVILPYKWGDHSGQIELAKDCGCHVIVPDIGFYKEQWDKLTFYQVSDNNYSQIPIRYTKALIEAYKSEPLEPIGDVRIKEYNKIIRLHMKIYDQILRN